MTDCNRTDIVRNALAGHIAAIEKSAQDKMATGELRGERLENPARIVHALMALPKSPEELAFSLRDLGTIAKAIEQLVQRLDVIAQEIERIRSESRRIEDLERRIRELEGRGVPPHAKHRQKGRSHGEEVIL